MAELKSIVKGTLLENEPMKNHTTYGVGGPATAFIIPKNKKDLSNVLQFAFRNNIKTYFVGSVSNLLVADDGVEGIVITQAKVLTSLQFLEKYVSVESGVMLGKLVKECIKRNLTGKNAVIYLNQIKVEPF